MDAPATDLEAQLRQLAAILARLVSAARELTPAPATFWHGVARESYDTALREVESGLTQAIEATQLAQRSTLLALVEELRA